MVRSIGSKFVFCIMVILLHFQISSSQVTPSVLLENPTYPIVPFLSGTKVVYQDYVDGEYKILSVDVLSKVKTEIRNNKTSYLWPIDNSGTHVAWIVYAMSGGGVGGRTANYSVMALKISDKTEKAITTNTAYKELVVADQNYVVWTDYRHMTSTDTIIEIYLYDLSKSTEKRITTASGYKSNPFVRDNKIVWQDFRNAGNTKNADIYLYDIATGAETEICKNGAYQGNPSVYGNYVVWQDYRNAGSDPKNADIYLYDLSTKTERAICTAPGYQGAPIVYEDFVVWQDYRNAISDTLNADIYMYNLKTNSEHVVTNRAGYQDEPALYGNTVVWQDYSDKKVYMGAIDKETGIETHNIGPMNRARLGISKRNNGNAHYDLAGRKTSLVKEMRDPSFKTAIPRPE